MKQELSPKYITDLAKKVADAIWSEFKSYDMVKFYISKWQKFEYISEFYEQANFEIIETNKGIDLLPTIMRMSDELLIKIAIDLGIDTPNFIPCIPTFKNVLKAEHTTTSEVFEKAYKLVYEDPSMAISLANSALESLIKEILDDERINAKYDKGHTLKKLINLICKAFMENDEDMPQEIRTISSSLIGISGTIEDLRSTKTIAHGKSATDYIVSNPLYAELIVNSVASVGLFLQTYYKQNYPSLEQSEEIYDTYEVSLPFKNNEFDINNNDIPF